MLKLDEFYFITWNGDFFILHQSSIISKSLIVNKLYFNTLNEALKTYVGINLISVDLSETIERQTELDGKIDRLFDIVTSELLKKNVLFK